MLNAAAMMQLVGAITPCCEDMSAEGFLARNDVVEYFELGLLHPSGRAQCIKWSSTDSKSSESVAICRILGIGLVICM